MSFDPDFAEIERAHELPPDELYPAWPTICPDCGGTGETLNKPCETCNGDGEV